MLIASMFGADANAVLSLAQAASLGLLHFPILNASVDEGCQNITYKVTPTVPFSCSQPMLTPSVHSGDITIPTVSVLL